MSDTRQLNIKVENKRLKGFACKHKTEKKEHRNERIINRGFNGCCKTMHLSVLTRHDDVFFHQGHKTLQDTGARRVCSLEINVYTVASITDFSKSIICYQITRSFVDFSWINPCWSERDSTVSTDVFIYQECPRNLNIFDRQPREIECSKQKFCDWAIYETPTAS